MNKDIVSFYAKITYSNGDKYEGQFKDDKYHGQGTKIYSNGDKYEGEFKDGKYHGQGTHTLKNGIKFEGTINEIRKDLKYYYLNIRVAKLEEENKQLKEQQKDKLDNDSDDEWLSDLKYKKISNKRKREQEKIIVRLPISKLSSTNFILSNKIKKNNVINID